MFGENYGEKLPIPVPRIHSRTPGTQDISYARWLPGSRGAESTRMAVVRWSCWKPDSGPEEDWSMAKTAGLRRDSESLFSSSSVPYLASLHSVLAKTKPGVSGCIELPRYEGCGQTQVFLCSVRKCVGRTLTQVCAIGECIKASWGAIQFPASKLMAWLKENVLGF